MTKLGTVILFFLLAGCEWTQSTEQEFWVSVKVISVWALLFGGGAFGGLLAQLTNATNGEERATKKVFLSRMAIGVGGAFVGYALLGVLPMAHEAKDMKQLDFVKLFGVAIACGFVGQQLLATSAKKLLDQVNAKAEKALESGKALSTKVDSAFQVERILTSAQHYYSDKRYALCIAQLEDAAKIDPKNNAVQWLLGLAYSRIDEQSGDAAKVQEGYKKALACFDGILLRDPHHYLTLFDRACIRTVSRLDTTGALNDLEQLFALKPHYKAISKTDADLQSLQGDPRFIALTNE